MRTSPAVQSIVCGPGAHLGPVERHDRRATLKRLRQRSDGAPGAGATLLVQACDDPVRLVAHVQGRWARTMSRMMAGSLDRRLAQGCSPESGVLVAARARALVSPAERQRIAYRWADLLTLARSRPGPRDPRAPLNREELLAHEVAVTAIVDRLVAPTPGHVRGIAILSSLLSDGSGPVYDIRRGAGLGTALDEAADLLASTVL